jgi:hypothetical protein
VRPPAGRWGLADREPDNDFSSSADQGEAEPEKRVGHQRRIVAGIIEAGDVPTTSATRFSAVAGVIHSSDNAAISATRVPRCPFQSACLLERCQRIPDAFRN